MDTYRGVLEGSDGERDRGMSERERDDLKTKGSGAMGVTYYKKMEGTYTTTIGPSSALLLFVIRTFII